MMGKKHEQPVKFKLLPWKAQVTEELLQIRFTIDSNHLLESLNS